MATDPVSKRAKIKEVPERPLPNLPDDVTVEILVRLPVKSLLRFRCVCKTWNSITSDPKFPKLHRMQPCVLFCEESKKIATINVESLLSIRAPTPAPSTPIFLPWEPDSSGSSQFLGSSNGLICVDYKSDHIPGNSGLILWNPSTRKFRRLPRPRRFGNRCTYAGFGYDESVDDYKLVWANSTAVPSFEERTIELDVLSLKSNTWRSHPPLNVNITTEKLKRNDTICGVFSNGEIHWVVKSYKHSLDYETRILALDLATEMFQFVLVPYDRFLTYHPDMGSLEGCLCLSAASKDGFRMELWMMKKYSVESANSWTKLVRTLYPIDPGYRTMGNYLLLFSNRDEIVAMLHSTNGCKMVKYYTKSRDVKPETRLSVTDHRDKTYCNAAFLHMESLVWLEEKEQQKE